MTYYSAKIEPNLPTGYTIEFQDNILIIDPPDRQTPYKKMEQTTKPINIIITQQRLAEKAKELAEDFRVITPPVISHPKILIYTKEQPIYLTKNTIAYLLNPPSLTPQQEAYYTLIQTTTLTILYAPRPTSIPKPPEVDIILTNQQTIQTAKKLAKNPNQIPNYIGADAQWCIILNTKTNKTEEPYIYIATKRVIIYRHLTQILARIE